MRVAGIPVRADFRWVIVLALIAAFTAGSIDARVGSYIVSLAFGIATTAVFFASIFAHEFAHAMAARLEKLDVVEIVLHPFGGLTRFRHEPETPRAEFRIAVAGPAASFLLAVFFAALMAAANAAALDILAILFFLLALSNFLLAVFNLFPGYPLDGGRVLRAYLWHSGRDLDQATIMTGRAGQWIAVGLIVFGLFIVIIRAEFFTGFWAVLTGLFLYDAAKNIIRDVEHLSRVIVDDVMHLPVSVEPDTDILHFVDQILPLHRQHIFPVAKDKQLFGMLMLEDLKKIARSEWRSTLASEVMRPVKTDHFVEVGTQLYSAREIIRSNGIGAAAVIDKAGRLVGFLHGSITTRKR